ncbi:Uma2 family endonuclease [Leptolyngbya sp. AN02str]|uniref:Uma2 family endonuclease n=1 Tax=Leptolyngbya sp. AN02str TaxID=3423363 RepID=UPI003D30FF85
MKLEQSAAGELVVLSLSDGETSRCNAEITADVVIWNEGTNLGAVFDSSTCFRLPGGGTRSPDVAWIERSRWEALSADERRRFPPICPDFVLELASPSDNITLIRAKMQESFG